MGIDPTPANALGDASTIRVASTWLRGARSRDPDVALNRRPGPLGFLAYPAPSAESPRGACGDLERVIAWREHPEYGAFHSSEPPCSLDDLDRLGEST